LENIFSGHSEKKKKRKELLRIPHFLVLEHVYVLHFWNLWQLKRSSFCSATANKIAKVRSPSKIY
jgi:hypothetical protein